MIDINQYTVEELANALYRKCQSLEVKKGTDKTKWREIVIAEKLGHIVHSKISAGKGTKEYGSDAFNLELSSYEEYKSKILSDEELRNLLELPKGKKGNTYAPLTVSGVYNGYNSNYEVASVEYPKKGHYFAVFYEELCVLIIKVNTDYVMKSLNDNYNKFISNGKRGSTNLNTVMVNLADTHLYTVAYKNEEFYDSKR
jgi:hypothetical protein